MGKTFGKGVLTLYLPSDLREYTQQNLTISGEAESEHKHNWNLHSRAQSE